MNKTLLTALFLTAALSANAQLRVSSNGQVTVGQVSSNGAVHSDVNSQGVDAITYLGVDTTSNLKIMGDN